MIDVAGAALLGAAARNAAGVASVADPAHYPRVVAELRELGRGQPGDCGPSSRPRRSARSPPITPRSLPTSTRSRATPSRDRLALVLEKVDDLRYGENPHQRAAFYRETTHRSGTLADATRLQRRHAVVQQPPRPRRRVPDRARLHARRPSRSSSTPDPVGLASHDELVGGLPARARDRPGRGVRRHRRGQPRARRRDRAGDRRQLVRGGRRARLQPVPRSASCAASPASSCWPIPPDPTEGMRDYGIASLDFKRVAGGLLVESIDDLGLDRGRLQVVTRAPPDARGADRPAVRVAGGPPRPLERDRPRPQRRDRRDRGGARPAARSRSRSRSAGPATGRRLAVLASDAYFPFPDGIQAAAGAGVTAIIQPGGSIRDEMAIEVADRHHMAMVFTGRRHFRH